MLAGARSAAVAALLCALAFPALAHVSLFGPKTYTAPAGAPQTVTERFDANGRCDGAANAVYTLVIANGDASGGARVAAGSISLNGKEVVAEKDFGQKVATIERVVTLTPTGNALAITIKGPKQSKLTISVRRHIDVTEPVFAERTFAIGTARQPFNAADLTGTFELVVVPSKLTGGGISLNGAQVVTKQELKGATATIRKPVTLRAANELAVELTGASTATAKVSIIRHVLDTAGPLVTLNGIVDGQTIAASPLLVSGTVADLSGVSTLTVNGAAVPIGANGAFSSSVPLTGGANPLVLVAADCESNAARKELTVHLQTTPALDTTAPVVTIVSPPAGLPHYNGTTVPISGSATDSLSGVATVTCNGAAATLDGSSFTCSVTLAAGANELTVVATDRAGNVATVTRSVTFATDHDAPSITAEVIPAPNASGWTRGPARVTFHCSDAISGIAGCPEDIALLDEGAGITVSGTAVDVAGNTATTAVTVNVDMSNPLLTLAAATPTVVGTTTFQLVGTVRDLLSGLESMTCAGASASRAGDMFTCNLTLIPGTTTIVLEARDRTGHTASEIIRMRVDDVAPTVAFGAPDAPVTTGESSFTVIGYADDESGVVEVTLNGNPVTLVAGRFETVVQLAEGTNVLTLAAADALGNSATASTTIERVTAVSVAITSPDDLATIAAPTVDVQGLVSPPNSAVVVNDIAAVVTNGTFLARNVPLAQGRTAVTAIATSGTGRVATANLNLYRDSIPPRVEVYSPAADAVVNEAAISVTGMVDDIVVGTINGAQVSVTVNGMPAEVANRAFLVRNVALTPGTNTLTVVATDQGGNRTTATHTITYVHGGGTAHIERVSGGSQTAAIGATLPQPLVVRLVDAAGAPAAGQPIVFVVEQNNGTLTGGSVTDRTVSVATNASGEAAVQWTLGTRAGAGNNRVQASAAGFTGTIEFLAAARTGEAAGIVVDSGANQYGGVNEPLQRPLIAVVVDAGSNRIAGVPVTFNVVEGGGNINGLESVTVETDSDGRAWVLPTLGPDEGNDNNTFNATFDGVNGVLFLASARKTGDPAQTRISGVVLDNSNVPIEGVSVRVDESPQTVRTDAAGQFVLHAAPVGYVKLIIDGTTAQRPGTWPTLEFVLHTLPGTDNDVGMPIYLLPIEVERGIQVDERTGGTLTVPELPGFSLTIAPGSALFPNGSRAGTVSATLVHNDKVPMVPGFGQQPKFIVTIQPTGVHFDPPAALTFPNVDGLAPGEITEMYSFDHDLGQFVAIGTGMVTDDGTTVRSDPGVGIIKGGWHCGGNPAASGNASCVKVSVQGPKYGQIGEPVSVTASGTPAAGGVYFDWEVADDPGDPNDDPSIASFLTQPACAGQPTCTATLKATRGGRVSVRVSFQGVAAPTVGNVAATAVNATQSKFLKVYFPEFQIEALRFDGSGAITRDKVGSATVIPAIQWVRPVNILNAIEDPVTYPRSKPGAPSKIKLGVQLHIPYPLLAPITDATLEGKAEGMTFRKTGLTIPAGVSNLPAYLTIEADNPLPETTKFYDPFTITWTYTLPGDPTPVLAGVTKNPLYVTLEKPLPGYAIFLSTLQYAVKRDGAGDEVTAVQNTWSHFYGPANITTWQGRPLHYYKLGFYSGAGSACSTMALSLLTSDTDSGQCGSFAHLLVNSFALNGIGSAWVDIAAKNGAQFLINDWTAGTPSYPNGPPVYSVVAGPLSPEWKPFVYKMEFNPAALAIGNYMEPGQPNEVYGDLTSLPTIPGQNTSPPREKMFISHYIVAPLLTTTLPVARFYDPSYGLVYEGPDDFEMRAVWGYMRPSAVLNPDNSFSTGFFARRVTDDSGQYLKNISFTLKAPKPE
jgi:hypothetical protein